MGQLLDTCKYRRDCKKCRLIDIETDDIFDDEPLVSYVSIIYSLLLNINSLIAYLGLDCFT